MLFSNQSKEPKCTSKSKLQLNAHHPNSIKRRTRLPSVDVLSIFQSKSTGAPATTVARVFGVNEKTIRDIWSGRTWAKETLPLDPLRCGSSALRHPKSEGSYDTKSKRKLISCEPLGFKSESTGFDDSIKPCSNNYIMQKNALPSHIEKLVFDQPRGRVPYQPCHAKDTSEHKDTSAPSDCRLITLDEQLHRWDGISYDIRSSDPFKKDWTLACVSVSTLQ